MASAARVSAQYKSKSGAITRRKIPANRKINIQFNGPNTSSNRFSALADLTDEGMDHESNITPASKSPKPPPIVVDISNSFEEIQHLLGNDCIYKRTSIGTKVFPQNADKYAFCLNALKENKIEFHSFNAKENRLFTIFLYGLPQISCDDIIEDIKGYNLTPVSVTEVKTKYSNVNDAVYKVQFTRNSFNPSSLRNIKSICNVIVTWKRHKPKRNEKPTQCWNCLMYGHGGEHCNRRSACMICANNHKSDDCPLNKSDKRLVAFTCFNCKKNGETRFDHSANDVNCPWRAHYLEARAKATTNNHAKRQTPKRRNSFVNNVSEYPSINGTIPSSRNLQCGNQASYSQQLKSNKSGLFNIDELFEIFTSALDDLSRCTNKVQQIQVVMNMVKYAYDFK